MTVPRSMPLLEPRPVVPLPGKWTFWADTMVGSVALGNVDVSSFYCVRRLSAFGHGNVTVNLPCGIPGDRLRRLWSWRIWALYDGLPYWCGVPTGLADQDGSAHVQFTLTELPGYLVKRAFDVWPDRKYVQEEQTVIARDIAAPVTEVGVVIITEPGGGVRRDRTYEYLESDNRGQLLSNLAGVLQGPEFRAEYRMTPAGLPQCVLRIAYPRVGDDTPGLGLSVPGAAVGYRAQWDADKLRTVTFAVGDLAHDAPEGTPRPVAIQTRPQPDLPRLDAVDDWPGTVLQTTLVERAQTMAERQAAPSLNMTASPPEELPPVSSYGPGDTVTIRVVTPLMPEGMEVAGRLSEIEVNAAEGVATWSIIGASPAPVVRETVNDRLTRMDSTLAQVFHGGQLAEVGGPTPVRDTLSGRAVAGAWNATGTGWARISEFAPMRATPPVGATVEIEAMGYLDWRANDLEFAMSWTGGPGGHVAHARVEGRSQPWAGINPLAMAVSVRATAIVAAAGQLRAHLTAGISPTYEHLNMAGGNPAVTGGAHVHGDGSHTHPTGNVSNNWTLEGDTEGTVAFNQAVSTSLNIVARFGPGAEGGQGVRMRVTKITYRGGAAP
jgi:hypothetical protein